MWRRTQTIWKVSDDGESLGFERTKKNRGTIVKAAGWFIDSGFLSSQQNRGLLTGWDTDGRVVVQYSLKHGAEERTGPPWIGGVSEQVKPTAPWLAAELTASEWWTRFGPPFHESLTTIRKRNEVQTEVRREAIDPITARLNLFNRTQGFLEAMKRGDRQRAEQILEEVGVTRQRAIQFFQAIDLRRIEL